MEDFELPAENLKPKIYWGIMLCAALGFFGFAAYQSSGFSLTQIFMTVVALIVTAFVNQHEVRLPKTSVRFSGVETIVFFGAIWLGVPGAVFLAVVASLARYYICRKNKFQWLFDLFANTGAAFISATAFYLVLHQFSSFSGNFVGDEPIGWLWLTVGITLITAAHFIVSGIFRMIFIFLDKECSPVEILKSAFAQPAIGYVISVFGAVLLHNLFLNFGLSFGLVILPATIIGHLAYRLHLQRLEQKTEEITEASRIHLATVEALATAIDARDQVGVGHVRRTQIYAVGIGEILCLPEAEINALNTGALLHDIGKLAVPDHILNKPGRLTPAEMEKTKIHSSVGASILEKVNFNCPVVPTVKHHHECWDGSGYPNGLKGQEIPLTARILSVADAYDTLRGARPYRAAVPREAARKFLLNGAGTQFDPRIVDLFLRNLKKFETAIEAEKLGYTLDNDIADDQFINTADQDSKSYVEQIKRANREVFTLYELARDFSSSINLESTFSLFAEKIGGFVPFDTCIIYLCDATGEGAKAVYTEGEYATELLHHTIKTGEGATGFVLKKRQSVCNVNPDLDFSFGHLELMPEYSAMASLPLIAGEKLLGAVSIYSSNMDSYEDEHLRLLETVSRIASDAISKSIHHAETETKALTDPMTGLPNARCLQIQFEKEVARAERNNTSFQILMLDLDGFKAVNDTFGHKAGDRLLRELSKEMNGQLREYDFLARYAGDEFVAIIPETEDVSVEELAHRLENAVNSFALPVGENQFARVGISIGAASFPSSGDTLDRIIIAADKAMYGVKSERKQLKELELKKIQEEEEEKIRQSLPQMISVINVELNDFAESNDFDESDMFDEPNSENFVVELDERHVVSSAIN